MEQITHKPGVHRHTFFAQDLRSSAYDAIFYIFLSETFWLRLDFKPKFFWKLDIYEIIIKIYNKLNNILREIWWKHVYKFL